MKRLSAIALGMLVALAGQNAALGQSPAGPTTVVKSTFPVANPPQQFQLIEQVVDFPPGSWTPPHSHGGQAFVTIAQGTVTQFSDGRDTTYQKGTTWTESPGHAHQAGNTTSEPARDLAVFLLPPGVQQTNSAQMENAHDSSIKTQARPFKLDVPDVARPFDVVVMLQDYAPGQAQASEAYGGPAFASVLEGELTLKVNGADKTVKAGETWMANSGEFAEVKNAGTAPASVFLTVLLPKGAALAKFESQASQPGTVPQTGGNLITLPFELLVISAMLLGTGVILWRRSGKRAR